MEQINPIIKADFPDPDVIRVEDTYYMICTTMHFFPGGIILRSYDLIHWEFASYVLTDLKVQMHNAFRESRASMEKGCGQQALDIIKNFMCAFLPMMLEKRICFPQMR